MHLKALLSKENRNLKYDPVTVASCLETVIKILLMVPVVLQKNSIPKGFRAHTESYRAVSF